MSKEFRVATVRINGHAVTDVAGRLRVRRDASGLLDWELSVKSTASLPRLPRTGTAEILLVDGRRIFGVYDAADVGFGDRSTKIELRGHGTMSTQAVSNRVPA